MDRLRPCKCTSKLATDAETKCGLPKREPILRQRTKQVRRKGPYGSPKSAGYAMRTARTASAGARSGDAMKRRVKTTMPVFKVGHGLRKACFGCPQRPRSFQVLGDRPAPTTVPRPKPDIATEMDKVVGHLYHRHLRVPADRLLSLCPLPTAGSPWPSPAQAPSRWRERRQQVETRCAKPRLESDASTWRHRLQRRRAGCRARGWSSASPS